MFFSYNMLFAGVEERVTDCADIRPNMSGLCEYSYNSLNIFQKPTKKSWRSSGLLLELILSYSTCVDQNPLLLFPGAGPGWHVGDSNMTPEESLQFWSCAVIYLYIF